LIGQIIDIRDESRVSYEVNLKEVITLNKINVIKVVNVVGTALGIVASLVTGWAQHKTMEKTVEKCVEAALKNKQ
jgi:fructose-1-phosphate kinase PfkB-like protein